MCAASRSTPKRVKALGAGSYALVFAAYDTALDRHVAIKVFREQRYAAAEIRREAQVLARIDHPNVVKLHEIGEEPPTSCPPLTRRWFHR